MNRAPVHLLAVAIASAVLFWGAIASAKTRGAVYSIAIGYNGLPPGADAELTPLRYADDDAAAFHQFARTLSQRSFLLAMLDRETQVRFPTLAAEARAPSLADLRRTVAEIQKGIDAAVAVGQEPTVLVFYSGHGARAPGDQGALTLVDGLLTRDVLYDEILTTLHPRFLHLFVDACNAEAVVRPRDVQAQVVEPSVDDLHTAFQKATLARFPRVGAVVASTAGAQAHEWDVYQSGIFTHEILSALRGAADIDGNRRIEYSELAAFLGAANRDVSDPRARPRTIVHPPPLDRRAPIVDLEDVRASGFIEGRPGNLGGFYIEDARGNRLLDLRAEPPFWVSLAVPADETIFLRNGQGTATLRLAAGERLKFDGVRIAENDVRTRGALASALRRGLFATSFGPGYYRGYVDQHEDLVTVEMREPEGLIMVPAAGDSPPAAGSTRRRAAWIAVGTAAALTVAGGIFGGMAWDARHDFENTYLEREADEANSRYRQNLTISLTSLVTAALAGGLGAYLMATSR